MWKWTDGDYICAVILDADSLDYNDIALDVKQQIPFANIFCISKHKIRDHEKYKVYSEYFDIFEVLQDILNHHDYLSCNIVSVSKNYLFLKEMAQYHIGTIYIGKLDKDYLKFAPDYVRTNIHHFFEKKIGYAAEVIASGLSNVMQKTLLCCNQNIVLNDGTEKINHLIIGGRYYPISKSFIHEDPLSFSILHFKNGNNKLINCYFDEVIQFLILKNDIDIFSYVPQKPNEINHNRKNRFTSLDIHQKYAFKEILECVKDFSQKNANLYNRKENVKDAFIVKYDVRDKVIVVIDDVYSSGNTINEICKMLYEAGAKKVISIVVAINQMITSNVNVYKFVSCPRCGKNMKLRIRSKDHILFYGCSDYPRCNKTLDCTKGQLDLKYKNVLEIEKTEDLDEEY